MGVAQVVLGVAFGCELGLDSRRVDAVGMETASHLSGQAHVSLRTFALDLGIDLEVDRGNNLGVAELPHVQMVGANNTGESSDILLDVVDAHSRGHGLEQDT